MGSNSGEAREKPVHSVYVDAFYMDKYEVTNAEYAEFLNAKGKHTDAGQTWLAVGHQNARIEYVNRAYRAKTGYEKHPVVMVSWYGAMAYAAWKGKRLPTEAEWEKAARGNLAGLTYPWGNGIDATKANYNRHVNDTTVVGKYIANGYGLYDMAGNVFEWCLDEYNGGFYAISPARNPLSGANSIQWILDNYTGVNTSRVLRGGSWFHSDSDMRCAQRGPNTPRVYGQRRRIPVVRGLLSKYLTPLFPTCVAGGSRPKILNCDLCDFRDYPDKRVSAEDTCLYLLNPIILSIPVQAMNIRHYRICRVQETMKGKHL